MTYHGSCHCGQVQFDVEGELAGAVTCNCSICQRKGAVMWFVPREALTVSAGEDTLQDYTFNKHVIHHRFCPTCGIHPYGEGVAPNTSALMAAINVRCLDDVDLDTVPVKQFDGRAL